MITLAELNAELNGDRVSHMTLGHFRCDTPQLKAFNDRAEEMLQSLKSLKRNYVIKLFADHAATQSLFASLATDLQRLIG